MPSISDFPEWLGDTASSISEPMRDTSSGCFPWFWGLVFIGAAVWGFIGWGLPMWRTHRTLTTLNYSRVICDNTAATAADHSNATGMFFDVKLAPGCFSGFVTLPPTWTVWQTQFRGNDPSDWFAYWSNGFPNPRGPFLFGKANGMTMGIKETDGGLLIRLEGKGTLRFYDIIRRDPLD